MVKAFFPIRYIDVEASAPHPPNTTYRVSKGWEHWGGENPVNVLKIQMCYGDKVSGRKAPSFPFGTKDSENVRTAIKEIQAGKGESGRGKIFKAGGKVIWEKEKD